MGKRKVRLRSRLLDFIVVILCLGACYHSLRLFWDELNSFTTRKDITEIAEIQYKYKVAQRKFNDRVVWERVQQHSPLYNADTIRTADQALAIITFKNKEETVLNLSEKTMIQIFATEDGQISISLGSGAVDIETGTSDSGVRLMLSNGSSVLLKAGSHVSANANSSSNENFFVVHNGNASLISSEGEEYLVTEGQSVQQGAGGNARMMPVTVTSLPVKANFVTFDNEKVDLNYDFKVSEEYEGQGIVVQVSKTPDFTEYTETYVSKKGERITVPQEEGRVYWRAFPESAPQDATNGTADILYVPEIILLSPSASSGFTTTQSVNFSWKGNEYAQRYRIEISDNFDFSSIVYSNETNSQNINVQSIKEGKYYWRVTPFYTIENIGYKTQTNYSSFVVNKEDTFASPLLSYPRDNTLVTTKETDTNLTFLWKSNVKDAAYKLIVSKDKNFSSITYEENTEFNRFSKNVNARTLPDGTYYWKVIRNSPLEKHSVESDTASFMVKRAIPKDTHLVFPPVSYSVEKDKLYRTQFLWVVSDDYEDADVSSVFQISKTENFKDVVFEVATRKSDTSNVQLATGTYYWRIGVKSDGSSSPLEYSSAHKLKVCDQLASPKIIWPPENGTAILPGSRELNITWKPVEDAQYYKARILDSDTKELIYEAKAENANKVTLKLPSDIQVSTQTKPFICNVQAYVDSSEFSDYRAGEKTEIKFNLRRPIPVTLVSPSPNERIDGKKALTQDTVFTWKAGDRADKTQFVLNRILKDGSLSVVKTVDNPPRQIKIPSLATGNYVWYIKASSNEGYVMDSVQSRFTVSTVPLLDTPRLNTPETGFVVNKDYLRNNREIVFSWNPVSGATEYSFELYLKDSTGKLKKIYAKEKLKDTQVVFTDLKILDVGDIEWHVTAYNKDGGKRVLQTSKEAVRKFRIDIPLPDKVRTKDPGKLYGE